jgi:dGTPase
MARDTENVFYSDFDTARIDAGVLPSGELRSVFQVERDRIIFSHAFRRLQSKTQVFQSGEFDFYRTRLTHSIEVAKIARSVAEWLNATDKRLKAGFCIDTDLVEAIGLAHDLGHPPFGHIGERKLNALMGEYGGFEGNAQTLRMLTSLFYAREEGHLGMHPSRALLDGVMKYKRFFSEELLPLEGGGFAPPQNHFLYDEDRPWLDFVLDGRAGQVAAWCASGGIKMNRFRSLECQIMDWADDTAYSINDLIDGIHARYLSADSLQRWAEVAALEPDQVPVLEELIEVVRKERHESFLNRRIGDFIHASTLVENPGDHPMADLSHRYRFSLGIDAEALMRARLYKRIAVELIFESPQIQRIEYKGGLMLDALFRALHRNYVVDPDQARLNLIPRRFSGRLASSMDERSKCRILCDSIAEMTDALAIRSYRQLFDPGFGSILDLV